MSKSKKKSNSNDESSTYKNQIEEDETPKIQEESVSKSPFDNIMKGLTIDTKSPFDDIMKGIRIDTKSPFDDIMKGIRIDTKPPFDDIMKGIRIDTKPPFDDIMKGIRIDTKPLFDDIMKGIRIDTTNPYNDYLETLTNGYAMNESDYSERIEQRNRFNELDKKYIELKKEFDQEQADKESIFKELQELKSHYDKESKLTFLKSRVHSVAFKKIKSDSNFLDQFTSQDSTHSVVVSIDIRKSTDLMLKAKTPQYFAEFITTLSEKLKEIIIQNYGIYDKFTGDGILAFFPDFYTGKENLFYALKAAEQCHNAFNDHYRSFRRAFSIVYSDTGLGIGLDFGKATLTNVGGDLTVVGQPVVYACRLSGAPPNYTLINQNMADELYERHPKKFRLIEHMIDIKHEGKAIVYQPIVDWEDIKLETPPWENETE